MLNKKRAEQVSKTYCILPWIHRFTNIGGEIQVCCASEEYDNNIRDNSGKKMNIFDGYDDEAIMNSDYMKEIRADLLKGKWPKLCERCRITESGGGVSRRLAENNRFEHLIEDTVENTKESGELKEVKVLGADFRLGNLCNLACRMCNPRSSSKWIKDWSKIDQEWFQASGEQMEEYKSYDWYKKEQVWNDFAKQLPNIEFLHFAGGEPLLIPQMITFLEKCVDEGVSHKISLSYNTNLTLLPEKLKAIWPKFKEVRLYVSLDAVGELNDYIRFPSKWGEQKEVIEYVDNNAEGLNVVEILVMCTVQAYNVLKLKPLYDYLKTLKTATPWPALTTLHHPEHYQTRILPEDLKKQAEQMVNEIIKDGQEYLNSHPDLKYSAWTLEGLPEVINYMNQESTHKKYWEEFQRVVVSKDKMRSEDLFTVLPEFKPHFQNQEPRV